MKNNKEDLSLFLACWGIIVVLVFGAEIGAAATGGHGAYLPMVYYDFPEEVTPSPSPSPTPTRTPTPTTTPPAVGEWIYIGRAGTDGETTVVYGVAASFCATIEDMKVEKTAWISSRLIPFDQCDPDDWGGTWPPPVFPPPPSLPPEFAYGEVFKVVLPYNVKQVCSAYYGLMNCQAVK